MGEDWFFEEDFIELVKVKWDPWIRTGRETQFMIFTVGIMGPNMEGHYSKGSFMQNEDSTMEMIIVLISIHILLFRFLVWDKNLFNFFFLVEKE